MDKRKILGARERKIIMTKSGSGSVTTKISLPITWLREMGLNEDNLQAIIEFDGDSIRIIKKGSKVIKNNISYGEDV